jgi:nucleotide-binding universal stress UspA family protein
MTRTVTLGPVRTIVSATNFTPASSHAMAGAFELGRHFGARLVLVHVVERKRDRGNAELRLAAIVRERFGDPLAIAVPVVVGVGAPVHEMIGIARREHADLIVIGAPGEHRALVPLDVEQALENESPIPVLPIRRGVEPLMALQQRFGQSAPPQRHCQLCGQRSEEIVCSACSQRVSAESRYRLRVAEEEYGRGMHLVLHKNETVFTPPTDGGEAKASRSR